MEFFHGIWTVTGSTNRITAPVAELRISIDIIFPLFDSAFDLSTLMQSLIFNIVYELNTEFLLQIRPTNIVYREDNRTSKVLYMNTNDLRIHFQIQNILL